MKIQEGVFKNIEIAKVALEEAVKNAGVQIEMTPTKSDTYACDLTADTRKLEVEVTAEGNYRVGDKEFDSAERVVEELLVQPIKEAEGDEEDLPEPPAEEPTEEPTMEEPEGKSVVDTLNEVATSVLEDRLTQYDADFDEGEVRPSLVFTDGEITTEDLETLNAADFGEDVSAEGLADVAEGTPCIKAELTLSENDNGEVVNHLIVRTGSGYVLVMKEGEDISGYLVGATEEEMTQALISKIPGMVDLIFESTIEEAKKELHEDVGDDNTEESDPIPEEDEGEEELINSVLGAAVNKYFGEALRIKQKDNDVLIPLEGDRVVVLGGNEKDKYTIVILNTKDNEIELSGITDDLQEIIDEVAKASGVEPVKDEEPEEAELVEESVEEDPYAFKIEEATEPQNVNPEPAQTEPAKRQTSEPLCPKCHCSPCKCQKVEESARKPQSELNVLTLDQWNKLVRVRGIRATYEDYKKLCSTLVGATAEEVAEAYEEIKRVLKYEDKDLERYAHILSNGEETEEENGGKDVETLDLENKDYIAGINASVEEFRESITRTTQKLLSKIWG